MGKKRIKSIDLSQEEDKKIKKKGRVIVKSGKQHGRIADMGAMMLEEMEKRQEAEKALTAKSPKVKEVAPRKKIARPKRVRSRRYRALRKLVKPNKLYPLSEAIEFIKKFANAQFEESIELHLITYETGALTKEIKTEKKAPLTHIKIGKAGWPKKKLLEKIQSLIKAVGVNKIKKAVLTSTMGPGIKLDLSQS